MTKTRTIVRHEDVIDPVDEAIARPPYLWGILAGLAAFLLYAVTLAPTTAFWDTSEYIATAHTLGIPHPPGNPFFLAVAKTWSLLLAPTGLSVAVRINLFAAATSAAGTGFFYLIAHRILAGIFDEPRFARIGALTSSVIGATAFTVWNQSNVNEKVYTLSVMIIAIVSWLSVRWHDRGDEPGTERYVLWGVFLLAIGSTSHMMSVLPAPAFLVLLVLTRPLRLMTSAFLGRAVLLGALGLSFNFLLPIRADLDPVINEGDPACASVAEAAASIFSRGNVGCPALNSTLTRDQYQTPPIWQRKAPFSAQIATFMQYFEWQWARGLDASELPSSSRAPFMLLFLALGFAGLYATWVSDRTLFAYLAVLATTLTVGLVVYLNFKHGYSLHAELPQGDREVRERDYFYLATFSYWGCLAGIGLAWTWHTVAKGMGAGGTRYRHASPILLIALIPVGLNWAWASRSGDYAARDWAYDLLMSVEPYAVLFTNGDNDTFPLWYVQEVEGIRKDVTVIVGQYLYTSWYPRQLQELTRPGTQRTFDATSVPGLHEDRPAPTEPLTTIDPNVLDQVSTIRLPEDVTVAFPKLAVTYPSGMVLDRSQQIALRIINDSAVERPIYFSSSSGLMAQLGLDRWGVRHGLTTKLELRNLETDEHEGMIQGSPEYGGVWFDLEKSLKLYEEIYEYRGLRDRDIWADRSTTMMPFQFYVMALQLSDVAALDGRSPEFVQRLQDDAEAFQIVAAGGPRGAPKVEIP